MLQGGVGVLEQRRGLAYGSVRAAAVRDGSLVQRHHYGDQPPIRAALGGPTPVSSARTGTQGWLAVPHTRQAGDLGTQEAEPWHPDVNTHGESGISTG